MKKHFTARNLLLLVVTVFFGSIIWSMGYETLLPLLRAEQWPALIANLVGLPLILIGTAVMLWGFWVFLRDVATLYSSAGWQQAQQGRANRQLSGDERNAAQRQAQSLALAHMRPGLLLLVGGIALIAIGGYVSRLG